MKSQRAYVQHVIDCIGRIAEDSAPGRDVVFASRTLQDAIVRNLQVLCESTQRIDELHKERHPEIDWSSIAGMRNVLVHDYFEVDFETVWDIVTRDLAPLEKAMRAILTALG
ncbi:MAG: HepT-like ribonuclease domain-containing protein [Candidatus Solibacter sp.]